MKKKIGLISTIFLGISSIIGSGSLFVPYKAAAIAGPAAILSWIIAGGIVLLLALCFSELAALYPKREGGWRQLKFNAPMVELAILIGLHTFLMSRRK